MSSQESLRLRGVRQNNLKGFDLDLPLGQLIVVTGPSGSGKSSLAFDTIYAEGQRRYVETFSPYTRQFMERMDRPAVDSVEGIPPAIAIEQANRVKTTRSTVGTITEINDYLKLFFTRVAGAFCPSCNHRVRPESAEQIVTEAESTFAGQTHLVAFEVPVGEYGADGNAFFDFLKGQGYLRVWLHGATHRTDEPAPKGNLPAVVCVVQDRVTLGTTERTRIMESVETALRFGKGKVLWINPASGEIHPFSTGWHCARCDIDIRPPAPGLFSFNNPLGACPDCRGFGRVIGIDLDRAIPDKSLSIANGVVKAFNGSQSQECQRDLLRACALQDVDIHIPFHDLPEADQKFVLYGTGGGMEAWENGEWYGVKGYFDWLETKTYKMHVRVLLSRYRSYNPCPTCKGGRYQPETLNFRLIGKDGETATLPDIASRPVTKLRQFLEGVALPVGDPAAALLKDQVASRLLYLNEVGLGYLTLDRPTRTLSGGEIQRVNLTTCLGASLVNTLFVMDEPSVGLHPRDVGRLLHVMHGLRDKGNTLLVVEHEEAVLRHADYLVDIGPGRGIKGGDLVYAGPLPGLATVSHSLTADYLCGTKRIEVPAVRRKPVHFLRITGASQHNIRNLDLDIPLGVFCSITGVSGSGKSTLVRDILYRNLSNESSGEDAEAPGHCERIEGTEHFDEVLMVDQSPLARTPRSTPALYIGVFDTIRELFGYLPEANSQGMTPSTFSFNAGTGRCERCHGLGFEKVEMQFLSDIFLRCPECDGKRYQTRVLKILLDGKSIHDVLEMTVEEALVFFAGKEKKQEITGPLRLLAEVGLGYLRLGQPVNVLSGGESQRLKLVAHLAEKRGKKALLIFDEPTTGLHFDDVALLLGVFQKLVEQGNSLLVIEHNLEVLKSADWLIDLGPDAGTEGGQLVYSGEPEGILAVEASHTGRHLAPLLSGKRSSVLIEEPSAEWATRFQGPREIAVHGAREHNLKNITVHIPRDKMVVVTGLSGSGKSTLAFDILFAEGQRRFLDSMSPYARQFVEQLEKPEVDLIEGLPPSVAIEQRITRGGGKSTVATVTEAHHFLRLLFSKLGTQYCPSCDLPVERNTVAAIAERAAVLAGRGTAGIYAPLVKAKKGFHTDTAKWAVRNGFEDLLVDGVAVKASRFQKLERFKEHSIDVLIGSISRRAPDEIEKVVRRALEVGKGTARILNARGEEALLSIEMSCPGCSRAFEPLDPRLFSFNSSHGWCPTCRGFGEVWQQPWDKEADSAIEAELAEERMRESADEESSRPCPDCKGSRLNEVARHVRIKDVTLADLSSGSATETERMLLKMRFTKNEEVIARDIRTEILQRLRFLQKVGLDYLALDRSAKTLSGGESQRIRLAAQMGSNLRGVLYVLDEPTIGLHSRDSEQLLGALESLVSHGNTLVVVEHDEDTMRRADHIIDLGPRAGTFGGEIVAQGPLEEIEGNPDSLTGRFLSRPLVHPIRGARRSMTDVPGWLELSGVRLRNLKDLEVRIPLERLTVVTGVSGSGKSTLLRGVVLPTLREALGRKGKKPRDRGLSCDRIEGSERIASVQEVDQSPIGKTSRSTPATYMKIFDEVRKHFAQLPASRMRGYSASRFSFNTEGGRCEICQGQGVIKLEMNFLPTSFMPCEACGGKRYNSQTLEVEYNGKNIGDVMDLTAEQAAEFFAAHPKIARPLRLLAETGLGYLKLGQPSPTLSGGEAQRLKLVTELAKGGGRRGERSANSTFYLLEEPTIGLHMADVELLLHLLHRLVDEGATVVVIEHNLELIAEADHLLDIGPEAGNGGGEIVAQGTPEKIAGSKRSRTAGFLKAVLDRTG